MKKQLSIVALAGFALLSLGGCDGSQQAGQQAPSSSSTLTLPGKTARATLTVTPGSVSTCENGAHVNPEVTWQRVDTTVKNTKVTVSSPGSADEKLFASGGFGGSAKAGDWVVPGVTFHLYDADTGAALGNYTVHASPCTN